uniref:WKF domain-containing protein n=1 Tax=Anopheles farauti TaxID=69004 RepID=A0A182QCA9_9DIPT
MTFRETYLVLLNHRSKQNNVISFFHIQRALAFRSEMAKTKALKKSKDIEGASEKVTPVANGKVAKKKDNVVASVGKKQKKVPAEQENGTKQVPSKQKSKENSNNNENTITAGTTIDKLSNINLKSKKSKRELKRENHAEAVQKAKADLDKKDWNNICQYLQTWKQNREAWKFQKRTQTNLQLHVFDEGKLEGDLWPIAVEYLGLTKGKGRDFLVKLAKEIVDKGDADKTAETDEKYERARELLQSLG